MWVFGREEMLVHCCAFAFIVFSKAGTCDTVPSTLEKAVSPRVSLPLSELIQHLNLAGFSFVTPGEA